MSASLYKAGFLLSSREGLLPADLGLLHRSQIGVINDVLLPIPAPRQGGVLLQDRGILLLGSRIIRADMKREVLSVRLLILL